MRRSLIAAALVAALALPLVGAAPSAYADTYVSGYERSDGSYVAPHYRSSPDSSTSNNWSTRGNTNPYTGEAGTHSAYPAYGGGYGGYGRSSYWP